MKHQRNMARKLTRADITDNIVIIKINKSYREGMSEQDLYDITRGCWKRRISSVKEAEFALAVVNGIVKEVYSIESWLPAEKVIRETIPYNEKTDAGRIAFQGTVAKENVRMKYLNCSVAELFKRGEVNPVKVFRNSEEQNEQK